MQDLNERLWAWIEGEYHQQVHGALLGLTPLERWRKDIIHIRPLGSFTAKLDEIFYHRHKRTVRKDGTVSFEGKLFEVPYELSGKTVLLVTDPHHNEAIKVESLSGEFLGMVTKLDPIANLNRKRIRPQKQQELLENRKAFNMVELALENYTNSLRVNITGDEDE